MRVAVYVRVSTSRQASLQPGGALFLAEFGGTTTDGHVGVRGDVERHRANSPGGGLR